MSKRYIYRLRGDVHIEGTRHVCPWKDRDGTRGATFWCPCGERVLSIATPPHEIVVQTNFEPDAITEQAVTINGSIGYHADPARGRPANWCHFSITNGQAVVHDDAQCPGKGNP